MKSTARERLDARAFSAWLESCPSDIDRRDWESHSDPILTGPRYEDRFPTLYGMLVDGVHLLHYFTRLRDRLRLKYPRVSFERIVIPRLHPHLRTRLIDTKLWSSELESILHKNIADVRGIAEQFLTTGLHGFQHRELSAVPGYYVWLMCFENKEHEIIKSSPGVCTIGQVCIGDSGYLNAFAEPGRIIVRDTSAIIFDSIHAWLQGKRDHLLPL